MREAKAPGAPPRPKYSATWISEFERAYVFGSARIRGALLGSRSTVGMDPGAFWPRR